MILNGMNSDRHSDPNLKGGPPSTHRWRSTPPSDGNNQNLNTEGKTGALTSINSKKHSYTDEKSCHPLHDDQVLHILFLPPQRYKTSGDRPHYDRPAHKHIDDMSNRNLQDR